VTPVSPEYGEVTDVIPLFILHPFITIGIAIVILFTIFEELYA
jgi:hypothetical protein